MGLTTVNNTSHDMNRILPIFILLTTFLALTSANTCGLKKWGKNCENDCFNCVDGCNDQNGVCRMDNCAPGWTSENDGYPTCTVPMCFGLKGCANNGKCGSLNTCLCGAES